MHNVMNMKSKCSNHICLRLSLYLFTNKITIKYLILSPLHSLITLNPCNKNIPLFWVKKFINHYSCKQVPIALKNLI